MSPLEDVFDLPPCERQDLLEVLTAPRRVRADAIQRYFGTPEGQKIADVLIDLEVDGTARTQVIMALRNEAPVSA